jgi:hypothetical protein
MHLTFEANIRERPEGPDLGVESILIQNNQSMSKGCVI